MRAGVPPYAPHQPAVTVQPLGAAQEKGTLATAVSAAAATKAHEKLGLRIPTCQTGVLISFAAWPCRASRHHQEAQGRSQGYEDREVSTTHGYLVAHKLVALRLMIHRAARSGANKCPLKMPTGFAPTSFPVCVCGCVLSWKYEAPRHSYL